MIVSREIHSALENVGEGKIPTASFTLKGWCFHEQGEEFITGIRARIGDRIFKANRYNSRAGLSYIYPQFPHAAKAGFRVELSLTKGVNLVLLEWKDANGHWQSLESINLYRIGFIEQTWRQMTGQISKLNEEKVLSYQRWVERYDTLNAAKLKHMSDDIDSWENPPRFAVLMPVHNPPAEYLEAAIRSVERQLWPHWEFCITDDASTQPYVRSILEKAAARDKRIKITWRKDSGHICRATNDALQAATHEFMVLLDHDDVLAGHALYILADKLREFPDAAIIYSDEDKMNEDGARTDPYFKANHDPYLFLQQNCISHLGMYRTALVRSVDGFRPGYEGSQDWDLALRCIENSSVDKVHHVPWVLYHWRILPGSTALHTDEKPYAVEAAQKSVQDHLERTGRANWEVLLTASSRLQISRPLPEDTPLVSIIIPTRNQAHLLRQTVDSLQSKTAYKRYEIIIMDNGSDEESAVHYLNTLIGDSCKVIDAPGPFNFSKLINQGVSHANGSVFVFLNNDVVITEANWLSELVSWAVDPEVGAVGARLLYPSALIQHAGVFLGYHGAAGHLCRGEDIAGNFNGGWSNSLRQVSAVTAACLAVTKDKFLHAGGFDEAAFGVAYNDVDFCLELQELGYRNIYNPQATLLHMESASRADQEASPSRRLARAEEITELDRRHGEILRNDPHYSPNLTLEDENLSPANPPRVSLEK
ncbi:N/A [soil metagenome]